MTKKNIKWTKQQQLAIRRRGSDVLVTASAGTGKTAVLSGRCVDIVSDKDMHQGISNMLVLTFTDAAAEQMQKRIREQLKAHLLEDKGNLHLLTELMLLPAADISTIHSFCKRLITEYFYQLDIDPAFRVIDTDEQTLLKFEAVEKTIEWAWTQAHLQPGLEQLFYGRDLRPNGSFARKIIDLSDFLDGVLWRQRWYERAVLLTGAVDPFETKLGEKQKQIIRDKLNFILNQLFFAKRLYQSCIGSKDWPAEWQQLFAEHLEQSIEALRSGDWQSFVENIRNFEKPRVHTPKDVEKVVGELIHKLLKSSVDQFVALSELAILNPDYLNRVGLSAGLQSKIVIELAKKFDRFYADAKQSANCMDFADLEHYALRLLAKPDSSTDEIKPSQTALSLRRRYNYIFIDEYQDINPVQEAIIKAVSTGNNVFVVGDIKQSIYAFRGAEPKIFLHHLKPASADPDDLSKPFRVDLNDNFRSAGPILDFVNRVFGRIMTKSFADIDYDVSAMLKPASDRPVSDNAGHLVELHILDRGSAEDEQQDEDEPNEDGQPAFTSLRRRQAAVIAQRIKKMVGAGSNKAEFQIYDEKKNCMRDVEYGDIVVLMRSPAKRINDYVQILRLAGIPVSCRGTGGYFEATESRDIISLLKVIDNPQRDIELAAVLRSPIFNVTDGNLAKIKIHSSSSGRCGTFYDCVVKYADDGKDIKLKARLREILQKIELWRNSARTENLADLLWKIYRESGFLSFVSALPDGQLRRANLLKLHDRAIQFEAFASSQALASLSRFVDFIERLEETGCEWAFAEPETLGENAVKITSIHKSKGLEFPVVILAELDNRFNTSDLSDDFLADENLTLGLQIIDRQSNSKLASLAHQVISEQKLRAALAEEMRILYVAATRAKDRLILTACKRMNCCRQVVLNSFFFGDEKLGDWQLRCCSSFLEWILCGLGDQSSVHSVLETGFEKNCSDNDLFSIKIYGCYEQQKLSGYIESLRLTGKGEQKKLTEKFDKKQVGIIKALKENLNWRYNFEAVSVLPAKRTVTQLTHSGDEFVSFDYSRALDRKPKAVLASDSADLVDSRLIGTAVHLLISKLDLRKPVTKKTVEETREKLLRANVVSSAAAERIDAESIVRFFESRLGKLTAEKGSEVWREWPFTFTLPVSDFNDSSDETVIVQGIIDMLIVTPGGIVIIDFKTDNIGAEKAKERAELYRSQLEIYSRAAETIVKKKVLSKWLYFLNCGSAVEIK